MQKFLGVECHSQVPENHQKQSKKSPATCYFQIPEDTPQYLNRKRN